MKLCHVQFRDVVRVGGKDFNSIMLRRVADAKAVKDLEYVHDLQMIRLTLAPAPTPRPEGDTYLIPREMVEWMQQAQGQKK